MRVTITAVAVLCLALGCGGVLSTHPVGGEPLAIGAEEWEGTWLSEDGVLEIRTVDEAAGKLEVAWIEDGGDGFELHTLPLELRGLADWTIGNLYDADEEKYLWLRVERDGERLLAWLPDEEEFARLVTDGALPGRLEDGASPVLARLEPAHLELIRGQRGGELFVWDEPLVLNRLSD